MYKFSRRRKSDSGKFIFLQHPYDSTGADYKSKGRLVCLLACLFVLGKFKDDYWLVCEPMRNKERIGGKSSAASLYSTECTKTVGTVEQEYWHARRHCSRLLSGDDW